MAAAPCRADSVRSGGLAYRWRKYRLLQFTVLFHHSHLSLFFLFRPLVFHCRDLNELKTGEKEREGSEIYRFPGCWGDSGWSWNVAWSGFQVFRFGFERCILLQYRSEAGLKPTCIEFQLCYPVAVVRQAGLRLSDSGKLCRRISWNGSTEDWISSRKLFNRAVSLPVMIFLNF